MSGQDLTPDAGCLPKAAESWNSRKREYLRQWARNYRKQGKAKAAQDKYYKENREQRLASMRAYAVVNKDRKRQYMKLYRKRSRINQRQLKHYDISPSAAVLQRRLEGRQASHRRWRNKNLAYSRQLSSIYAKTPKAKLARELYRKANKDKVHAWQKRWRERNRSKIQAQSRRRQVMRRQMLKSARTDKWVDHVIASWKAMPTFICYYCDREFDRSQLHIDHIIPLARRGSHTIDNICTSCPPCNLSKHDRLGTLPVWCWPFSFRETQTLFAAEHDATRPRSPRAEW